MRLLGAIGLAVLALINLGALVAAVRNLDWKGIALMLFLALLLTFFARTLWRGHRIAQGREQGRLVEGWEGEPLASFISSAMARTVEGRIYIAGAVASELMAALIWFMPAAVAISTARARPLALLFAFWPIIGFVLYIRICGPEFKTTALRIILTLAVVLVPFYQAYVR